MIVPMIFKTGCFYFKSKKRETEKTYRKCIGILDNIILNIKFPYGKLYGKKKRNETEQLYAQ